MAFLKQSSPSPRESRIYLFIYFKKGILVKEREAHQLLAQEKSKARIDKEQT